MPQRNTVPMNQEKAPITLELMDFKEMETSSIETIRTGHKMCIAGNTTLEYAERMIKALGKETERERIARVAKETKERATEQTIPDKIINNTAETTTDTGK